MALDSRQGLTVTWTDPRGKVWDLTAGTQGVILDLGQEGLGWAELDHTFTRGDLIHVASRVKRGRHNLKVLVGHGLTGQEFFDLYREWRTQANSPYEEGELAVTTPAGDTRTRRLRLNDTPDTSHAFDPGLGLSYTPELWSLTGDYGWWLGPEQRIQYTPNSMAGGNDMPFYGQSGAGWPLYIANAYRASDAYISNTGQGPMWLTWTLAGPMSRPRVGVVGSSELVYEGDLLASEVVQIITDPAGRAVVEASTGASRYGQVTGTWAPAPVGSRVPLIVGAGSMGSGASIYVAGRPAYGTAF